MARTAVYVCCCCYILLFVSATAGQPFATYKWKAATTTTPAAYQLRYEGCFLDSNPRDFPYKLTLIANAPETCAARCHELGYTVFGLQSRRTCFCGHTFGSHGPSSSCVMRCPARPTAYCGGNWANNVYTIETAGATTTPTTATTTPTTTTATTTPTTTTPTTTTPTTTTPTTTTPTTTTPTTTTPTTTTPTTTTTTTTPPTTTTATTTTISLSPRNSTASFAYVGCYLDAPTSDLAEEMLDTAESNSPVTCAALCWSHGYDVMGLSWGEACWCGQTYGRYGKSQHWPCDQPCPGDCESTCGGPWTLDVYTLSKAQ